MPALTAPGKEEAMQETTIMQSPAPQSSVTLSQTAKGATQVEVKCYSPDPDGAAAIAQRIYDELTAKYAQGQQP